MNIYYIYYIYLSTLHAVQSAGEAPVAMYRADMYFKTDPELAVIATEFAEDAALLLRTAAEAWTLLMNADMFAGPRGISCNNYQS